MSLNINGKKTGKDDKNRKNIKLIHMYIFKNKVVQLILFFIAFLIGINVISYFNNKETFKPTNMEAVKAEHKKEMDEMDILMEKLKKEKELRDSKKEVSTNSKIENKDISKIKNLTVQPNQKQQPSPNQQEQKTVGQLFNNTKNTNNVKKEQKMTRYEDWVDEPADTNEQIDKTNNAKQEEIINKNELMQINSEKDTEVER